LFNNTCFIQTIALFIKQNANTQVCYCLPWISTLGELNEQ